MKPEMTVKTWAGPILAVLIVLAVVYGASGCLWSFGAGAILAGISVAARIRSGHFMWLPVAAARIRRGHRTGRPG
jgi:hypothetical protein